MSDTEIKLLLVEDDLATALLHSEYLGGEGYTIRHVQKIGDAIAEIETANFDAILLDLNIIGSSGLDTVRTIAPLTDIPIIVLTGSIGEDTAQQAKDLGAVDYLMKEKVRPSIVARVLKDAINEHNRYRIRSLADRLESLAGRFDG